MSLTEKKHDYPEIPQLTEDHPTTISRRDVLKVAWTTPIVLAMSPSLEILPGSGGDTTTSDAEGHTPGLWRQIGNDNNDNKQGNDPSEGVWGGIPESYNYTPSSNYADTFGVSTTLNITLLEAVDLKGKRTQEQNLARAATAALLNAANPDINYPYNVDRVKQLVQQAFTDAAKAANDKERDRIFEALKNDFDEKNNLGTK